MEKACRFINKFEEFLKSKQNNLKPKTILELKSEIYNKMVVRYADLGNVELSNLWLLKMENCQIPPTDANLIARITMFGTIMNYDESYNEYIKLKKKYCDVFNNNNDNN
eukprot:Pgem_evm1s11694